MKCHVFKKVLSIHRYFLFKSHFTKRPPLYVIVKTCYTHTVVRAKPFFFLLSAYGAVVIFAIYCLFI